MAVMATMTPQASSSLRAPRSAVYGLTSIAPVAMATAAATVTATPARLQALPHGPLKARGRLQIQHQSFF
jgi:hypothetical protein